MGEIFLSFCEETRLKEVLGDEPGSCERPRRATETDDAQNARGDQCHVAGKDEQGQPETEWTEHPEDVQGKKLNRLGPDGKPMTCFCCKSEYHFMNRCEKKKDESPVLRVGVM